MKLVLDFGAERIYCQRIDKVYGLLFIYQAKIKNFSCVSVINRVFKHVESWMSTKKA